MKHASFFLLFCKVPFLILFLLARGVSASEALWAFVKVPVTELVSRELTPFKECPYTFYTGLPYSPEDGPLSCVRVHQLKFNEMVKICSCTENELECEIQNFLYITKEGKKAKGAFWGRKQDFGFLNTLSENTLCCLPKPYTLGEHLNTTILTLIEPWTDCATSKVYSVGTRFVRNKEGDIPDFYAVTMLDEEGKIGQVNFIPGSSALVEYPQTATESIALFVKLLRKWAHRTSGFIPYVWGGNSFTTEHCSEFSLISHTRKDPETNEEKEAHFWDRERVTQGPASGFDCSGLLLCAAQISNMPYFLKNTTTIETCLNPLKEDEKLKVGDLIWVPGHVMVVSSLEENLVIEAAGYGTGYGKLHEIPIHKVFKDSKDFSELMTASRKGTPLKRLNNKGEVPENAVEKQVKLFSLNQLWEALDGEGSPLS